MKNPRKEPKAISFIVVQAELMRELAREQIALANDTLELVRQLRELLNYAMRIGKPAPVRAQVPKGKIISFPIPPHAVIKLIPRGSLARKNITLTSASKSIASTYLN